MSRGDWAMLVGCILCVAYTWMPAAIGAPNERSRLYLAHALTDRGSIAVDVEIERWGMTFDIARRDGSFYSDKAPGSSVLAAPAVWLVTRLNPDVGVDALVQRVRDLVMLPVTLVAGIALAYALAMLGVSPGPRRLAVCAFLLGTPVLHYGHAYFGHVMAAAAVAITLAALLAAERARGWRRALLALSCGAAAGTAFAVEYQAAVVAIGLAAALLVHPDTRRPTFIAAVAVGVALPVAATLGYNAAAFGSPLSTSYDHLFHQHSANLHGSGIGGVTVPTLESLAGVVLSPHRGLLFCAPAILWGALGAPALWKRSRGACVFASVVFVAYAYIGSASSIWWGGWGLGPRLLIPLMVPGVVAFACQLDQAQAARRATLGVGAALALLGVAYNLTVVPLWPELPPEFRNPVASVVPVLIERDLVAWNLGAFLFGIEGVASVVPLWLGGAALLVWALLGVFERRPPWWQIAAAAVTVALWGTALALYPDGAPEGRAEAFVRSLEGLRQKP